jgi:predicted  nucleic acid-binding Zn-ribbon protein
MAKELARIEKNDNRLRTDIQGLRREIQTLNDNQDALLSRLENTTNLIEQLLGTK